MAVGAGDLEALLTEARRFPPPKEFRMRANAPDPGIYERAARTAEERGLLHSPEATDEQRAIYAEGYSVARLRERALKRRHYDRHDDLWQGLRIIFRSLARGAPALGAALLRTPRRCACRIAARGRAGGTGSHR